MRVIRCDRCNIEVKVAQEIIDQSYRKYDLCPQCHIDFLDFIKAKKGGVDSDV